MRARNSVVRGRGQAVGDDEQNAIGKVANQDNGSNQWMMLVRKAAALANECVCEFPGHAGKAEKAANIRNRAQELRAILQRYPVLRMNSLKSLFRKLWAVLGMPKRQEGQETAPTKGDRAAEISFTPIWPWALRIGLQTIALPLHNIIGENDFSVFSSCAKAFWSSTPFSNSKATVPRLSDYLPFQLLKAALLNEDVAESAEDLESAWAFRLLITSALFEIIESEKRTQNQYQHRHRHQHFRREEQEFMQSIIRELRLLVARRRAYLPKENSSSILFRAGLEIRRRMANNFAEKTRTKLLDAKSFSLSRFATTTTTTTTTGVVDDGEGREAYFAVRQSFDSLLWDFIGTRRREDGGREREGTREKATEEEEMGDIYGIANSGCNEQHHGYHEQKQPPAVVSSSYSNESRFDEPRPYTKKKRKLHGTSISSNMKIGSTSSSPSSPSLSYLISRSKFVSALRDSVEMATFAASSGRLTGGCSNGGGFISAKKCQHLVGAVMARVDAMEGRGGERTRRKQKNRESNGLSHRHDDDGGATNENEQRLDVSRTIRSVSSSMDFILGMRLESSSSSSSSSDVRATASPFFSYSPQRNQVLGAFGKALATTLLEEAVPPSIFTLISVFKHALTGEGEEDNYSSPLPLSSSNSSSSSSLWRQHDDSPSLLRWTTDLISMTAIAIAHEKGLQRRRSLSASLSASSSILEAKAWTEKEALEFSTKIGQLLETLGFRATTMNGNNSSISSEGGATSSLGVGRLIMVSCMDAWVQRPSQAQKVTSLLHSLLEQQQQQQQTSSSSSFAPPSTSGTKTKKRRKMSVKKKKEKKGPHNYIKEEGEDEVRGGGGGGVEENHTDIKQREAANDLFSPLGMLRMYLARVVEELILRDTFVGPLPPAPLHALMPFLKTPASFTQQRRRRSSPPSSRERKGSAVEAMSSARCCWGSSVITLAEGLPQPVVLIGLREASWSHYNRMAAICGDEEDDEGDDATTAVLPSGTKMKKRRRRRRANSPTSPVVQRILRVAKRKKLNVNLWLRSLLHLENVIVVPSSCSSSSSSSSSTVLMLGERRQQQQHQNQQESYSWTGSNCYPLCIALELAADLDRYDRQNNIAQVMSGMTDNDDYDNDDDERLFSVARWIATMLGGQQGNGTNKSRARSESNDLNLKKRKNGDYCASIAVSGSRRERLLKGLRRFLHKAAMRQEASILRRIVDEMQHLDWDDTGVHDIALLSHRALRVVVAPPMTNPTQRIAGQEMRQQHLNDEEATLSSSSSRLGRKGAQMAGEEEPEAPDIVSSVWMHLLRHFDEGGPGSALMSVCQFLGSIQAGENKKKRKMMMETGSRKYFGERPDDHHQQQQQQEEEEQQQHLLPLRAWKRAVSSLTPRLCHQLAKRWALSKQDQQSLPIRRGQGGGGPEMTIIRSMLRWLVLWRIPFWQIIVRNLFAPPPRKIFRLFAQVALSSSSSSSSSTTTTSLSPASRRRGKSKPPSLNADRVTSSMLSPLHALRQNSSNLLTTTTTTTRKKSSLHSHHHYQQRWAGGDGELEREDYEEEEEEEECGRQPAKIARHLLRRFGDMEGHRPEQKKSTFQKKKRGKSKTATTPQLAGRQAPRGEGGGGGGGGGGRRNRSSIAAHVIGGDTSALIQGAMILVMNQPISKGGGVTAISQLLLEASEALQPLGETLEKELWLLLHAYIRLISKEVKKKMSKDAPPSNNNGNNNKYEFHDNSGKQDTKAAVFRPAVHNGNFVSNSTVGRHVSTEDAMYINNHPSFRMEEQSNDDSSDDDDNDDIDDDDHYADIELEFFNEMPPGAWLRCADLFVGMHGRIASVLSDIRIHEAILSQIIEEIGQKALAIASQSGVSTTRIVSSPTSSSFTRRSHHFPLVDFVSRILERAASTATAATSSSSVHFDIDDDYNDSDILKGCYPLISSLQSILCIERDIGRCFGLSSEDFATSVMLGGRRVAWWRQCLKKSLSSLSYSSCDSDDALITSSSSYPFEQLLPTWRWYKTLRNSISSSETSFSSSSSSSSLPMSGGSKEEVGMLAVAPDHSVANLVSFESFVRCKVMEQLRRRGASNDRIASGTTASSLNNRHHHHSSHHHHCQQQQHLFHPSLVSHHVATLDRFSSRLSPRRRLSKPQLLTQMASALARTPFPLPLSLLSAYRTICNTVVAERAIHQRCCVSSPQQIEGCMWWASWIRTTLLNTRRQQGLDDDEEENDRDLAVRSTIIPQSLENIINATPTLVWKPCGFCQHDVQDRIVSEVLEALLKTRIVLSLESIVRVIEGVLFFEFESRKKPQTKKKPRNSSLVSERLMDLKKDVGSMKDSPNLNNVYLALERYRGMLLLLNR